MWGTKAHPDDDSKPDDLESLRDQRAFELRRTVELRWRDVLAFRAVLAEIADLFGEPMVHNMLATPLDLIEAKVLELYQELCRRGERFPLPERDEERISLYRGWVRWEDLKEPGPSGSPTIKGHGSRPTSSSSWTRWRRGWRTSCAGARARGSSPANAAPNTKLCRGATDAIIGNCNELRWRYASA